MSDTIGLGTVLNIGVEDALQRAEMWGDFAKEFLRLALLSHAMRGPREIGDLAARAAAACRDVMDAEKQIADRNLEFSKKFREAAQPQ